MTHKHYDVIDEVEYQQCGICLKTELDDESIEFDSPSLSELTDVCSHFACKKCWLSVSARREYNCPFCRKPLGEWLETNYETESVKEEPSERDQRFMTLIESLMSLMTGFSRSENDDPGSSTDVENALAMVTNATDAIAIFQTTSAATTQIST